MTIQLSFDFTADYIFQACEDVYLFALSTPLYDGSKCNSCAFRRLKSQATDLVRYGFIHGYINSNTYDYLSQSLLDSYDNFYQVGI